MAETVRDLDTAFLTYCIDQYFAGKVSANEAMEAMKTAMTHDGLFPSATESPEGTPASEQPAPGYRFFKTGYTSILVPEEDADDFEDGYCNGWVDYPPKDHLLTANDLRRMILEMFVNPDNSVSWNTGYILGMVRGIYEGGYYGKHEEPEVPFIQVGEMTLRLNRPYFCAGWMCGYENYGASHAQRLAPKTVTAIELMRYLTHYNPYTRTYTLDKEQVSSLEETLGRLVGYLCAALLPATPKPEQDTDSLPVVVAQQS